MDLTTPEPADLAALVATLAGWQRDDAPVPLHPGDVGWFHRLGSSATAAALRVWTRDGGPVAIGLRDGGALLRLAVDPAAEDDPDLATRVADDLADPGRGVLPDGTVALEARAASALTTVLRDRGWTDGESWTPLRRDLAEPVPDPGRRTVVDDAEAHSAVVRAAFGSDRFTPERWRAMAAGPAYTDARSLVALDDAGRPVAAATVWSAGEGRPGLLEPVGVHPDHRGHGHGRAVVLAAAAALRELDSSSATVCTPTALTGAVATYRSAGFTPWAEVRDLTTGPGARP